VRPGFPVTDAQQWPGSPIAKSNGRAWKARSLFERYGQGCAKKGAKKPAVKKAKPKK
jgi:hypothetical protein